MALVDSPRERAKTRPGTPAGNRRRGRAMTTRVKRCERSWGLRRCCLYTNFPKFLQNFADTTQTRRAETRAVPTGKKKKKITKNSLSLLFSHPKSTNNHGVIAFVRF